MNILGAGTARRRLQMVQTPAALSCLLDDDSVSSTQFSRGAPRCPRGRVMVLLVLAMQLDLIGRSELRGDQPTSGPEMSHARMWNKMWYASPTSSPALATCPRV